MSGSAFVVTHHAFSSGAGRTSDGNGSHASTLKSPSYTKSVSWQHHRTNDNVPGLLSLITAHLKDLPDDGRNEDVFKMLRSSAAILHGINNLRNNYSMAHPTETLLNEADARFAINLVRSIMTYVDELL